MKYIVTLIIFLNIQYLSAKFSDRIADICKLKDYRGLTAFMDSLSINEVQGFGIPFKYSVTTLIKRQIIDDSYEVMYEFMEKYKEGEIGISTYRLNLLSYNDSIVYCKMTAEHFVDVIEPVISYTDNEKFVLFNNTYRDHYKRSVSVNDFFKPDIEYGRLCGRTPEKLKYRIKCDNAIKFRNISLINKWLGSPITELQIYAFEALTVLKKKGLKLSDWQLQTMQLVKSKQGGIRTCSFCVWDIIDISEIVQQIEKM